jgi:hypothetical protein
MAVTLQNWEILCPEEKRVVLKQKVTLIKKEASQVLWLKWK